MSYSELKNHKLASYIVCVVIGIVFFLGLMFVIMCLTSQNYVTKKSYTEIITEQQKNIVYNFEKQKFKLNNIAVQLINNKIISDVIFTYGEKDIYTYKEASVHTEQYLTYNGIEKAVFYNENIGKVFVSSSMIPIDFDEYVSYTPHIKYAINEYKNGNRIVNENAINKHNELQYIAISKFMFFLKLGIIYNIYLNKTPQYGNKINSNKPHKPIV